MPKPSGDSPDAALFLTPEPPYPLAGGGALRSASLLEYLARRYPVDVVAFRERGAPPPPFPPGLVRDLFLIDLPPHARHPAARIARNALRLARRVPPLVDRFRGAGDRIVKALAGRRYRLALIEHFWCAPYWQQLAPLGRRTVLDLHNIESVLHQRCSLVEPWPAALAHRWFRGAAAGLERRWWPRFSELLATSAKDAALVAERCPAAQITIYPNALPWIDCPAAAEDDAVVFSGNLEYHPNVTAVRFFRRHVWPQLRARWPHLVWRLVGRNPEAVRRYTRGDDRIQLTGPVPDAVAEIARAKVAVVPLLAASGTRVKILEAWAAARSVVSTPIGAEGLPALDGDNLLLAAGPAEFSRAINRLLEAPDLRARIGRSGRALYEKEFTWDSAWRHLHL